MTNAATFTADQANRMLPLVRRVVADLVSDYRRWQETVHEFELLSIAKSDEPVEPRLAELQRDASRLAADIEHYLAELSALGLTCKSLEEGLVDFPGEVDGAPALLCWKLGEPAVAWWHRPDAGFAGRQPLPGVDAPDAKTAGAAR
jgi:hypothetical protein